MPGENVPGESGVLGETGAPFGGIELLGGHNALRHGSSSHGELQPAQQGWRRRRDFTYRYFTAYSC